jgi:hypothetical protein
MTSADLACANRGRAAGAFPDLALARATGLATLVITGAFAVTSLAGLSCETPLGPPTLAVAIRVMTATHPNTRQFRPLGPCAISFSFPFRVGAD